MKCPQCDHPVSSLKTRLSAHKDHPAICHQCRSEFYVPRYFSGFLLHGFVGTGLIVLASLLVYEFYQWLGVLLLLLLTGLLWMSLAYIESDHFQVRQAQRSFSEPDPSYQGYLWVIIWIIVAVLVLSLINEAHG